MIMTNLSIYEKFRNVPKEAQKEIGAGRLKGFTDINPMWRIKMLTDQFGVCGFGWYTEIVEQKIEIGSDGQKAAFVTINLFVKTDSEWSKAIVGVGGSSFVTNERNGAYTSDECFKMAYTDALSIACKSLGMGADVYFAKDRTKYDQDPQEPKQPQKPVAPQPEKEQSPLQIKWKAECTQITSEIAACKNVEELQLVWGTYEEFQNVQIFKSMVNLKKSELTTK
jgi:hypothetical protein